jgi:uncharacterized membrane protein
MNKIKGLANVFFMVIVPPVIVYFVGSLVIGQVQGSEKYGLFEHIFMSFLLGCGYTVGLLGFVLIASKVICLLVEAFEDPKKRQAYEFNERVKAKRELNEKFAKWDAEVNEIKNMSDESLVRTYEENYPKRSINDNARLAYFAEAIAKERGLRLVT